MNHVHHYRFCMTVIFAIYQTELLKGKNRVSDDTCCCGDEVAEWSDHGEGLVATRGWADVVEVAVLGHVGQVPQEVVGLSHESVELSLDLSSTRYAR